MNLNTKLTPQFINYLSWFIATSAVSISLIFSELLKYPPCTLCWYQRVFMYPLFFIIPVGIIYKDLKIHTYVFILSLVGFLIATYHTLIYHNIIQEALKLCTAELSCKTKQFELFGFLSIPMMSFLSFLFILILNYKGLHDAKRN